MIEEPENLEIRLKELRSEISDVGHEIDNYKAKTAAALGAGVFALLLAAGAAYEIITGNTSLYSGFGISRDLFQLITLGLGVAGFTLTAIGVARRFRRDRARESHLAELEEEFAELTERTKELS